MDGMDSSQEFALANSFRDDVAANWSVSTVLGVYEIRQCSEVLSLDEHTYLFPHPDQDYAKVSVIVSSCLLGEYSR